MSLALSVTEREQFLLQHKGLIGIAIKRHAKWLRSHPALEWDDLFNVGFIGLMKAYESFNPDFKTKEGKNVQFSTYAFHMINGELLLFKRGYNDGAKISRPIKEIIKKILNAEHMDKTPEEIADLQGISIKLAKRALEAIPAYKNTLSIHYPVCMDAKNGRVKYLEDILTDSADLEVDAVIKDFVETLHEKEKAMIRLHLMGFTQVEIGKEMGVSQVVVSRRLRGIFKKACEYGKEHDTANT